MNHQGPPGADFTARKEIIGHDTQVSVQFSKEKFAEADTDTFGQFVSEAEVIFGRGERRTTENKMLQPHIEETGVFFVVHGAGSLCMLCHIRTPVLALSLGGELIGDVRKVISARTRRSNVHTGDHDDIKKGWCHWTMAEHEAV
jgi:hypothetical protein